MTSIQRVNRNLNEMLNDMVGGDFYLNQNGMYCGNNTMPAVNVLEDEDNFAIEVAAPGMTKENFNIEFDNGKLIIKAEVEKKEDSKNYVKREFNYSSFSRMFTVSKNKVDDSKIGASYENGVLKVTLPKREEVKPKPKRTVEIA